MKPNSIYVCSKCGGTGINPNTSVVNRLMVVPFGESPYCTSCIPRYAHSCAANVTDASELEDAAVLKHIAMRLPEDVPEPGQKIASMT